MKILFLMFVVLLSLNAEDIAIVKSVKGEVIIKASELYDRVSKGMSLQSNMTLLTKDNSSITIIFKDNSVVVLGSNSILNLKKFIFEPIKREFDFELYLDKGSLSFESGKIGELSPESFELKTPESVVAIRGTKFFVKIQ